MSRKNDILNIGFGAFAPRPYSISFAINVIIALMRVVIADIKAIFCEVLTFLSGFSEFVIM